MTKGEGQKSQKIVDVVYERPLFKLFKLTANFWHDSDMNASFIFHDVE